MSQASFEEVVRAWLLDYDGRLPNSNRERKEAFLVLLVNLANYGYGKEELNTGKKEKIVRSCVNPNHHNKKKLRVWISIVVNDLEDAILISETTNFILEVAKIVSVNANFALEDAFLHLEDAKIISGVAKMLFTIAVLPPVAQ